MVNAKPNVKKRVSKKTKIAWRKHVNIDDVEDYLQEKRADERLGGPIEILPDQQLFHIETKPANIFKSDPKRRKKLLYNSTPRCFQILQPSSKVPDPITKRNRVRTKEERRDRIALSIEESNRSRGIVKQKYKLAQLNRIKHKIRKEASTYKRGTFMQDLWEIEENDETKNLQNEWNNNDTIRHNFQGLGKLRKEVPKSLTKKKSVLPDVELPHPGMSYNPSFKDHQDLLKTVAEKEQELIKKDEHIHRVTTNMFSKVTPRQQNLSWLTEMTEGLIIPEVKEEPDSESDNEYKSINAPVKNSKKNQKQRRKQKEQRELEESKRRSKIERKKNSDIYKLKMLKKQIEKKELLEKKEKEKRKLQQHKKELKTKQLSSRKFEELDLEFNMGEDISGNLRSMKSEGNLLMDRFKSMQKRNILEPTILQFKKKGKVKKFEKATHKMGWEPKGY